MDQNKNSEDRIKDNWHSDPKNWKWGIFYYNKEDKRLLPPKRIKYLGWTVNFAHPYSVIFLILFMIIVYIILWIIKNKV